MLVRDMAQSIASSFETITSKTLLGTIAQSCIQCAHTHDANPERPQREVRKGGCRGIVRPAVELYNAGVQIVPRSVRDTMIRWINAAVIRQQPIVVIGTRLASATTVAEVVRHLLTAPTLVYAVTTNPASLTRSLYKKLRAIDHIIQMDADSFATRALQRRRGQ